VINCTLVWCIKFNKKTVKVTIKVKIIINVIVKGVRDFERFNVKND